MKQIYESDIDKAISEASSETILKLADDHPVKIRYISNIKEKCDNLEDAGDSSIDKIINDRLSKVGPEYIKEFLNERQKS